MLMTWDTRRNFVPNRLYQAAPHVAPGHLLSPCGADTPFGFAQGRLCPPMQPPQYPILLQENFVP